MSEFSNRPLRVFLCHSSNDKPLVRELYRKLCAEAWIQPWLDEEELYPGQDWHLEIEKAVEDADVILVGLSNNSINKEGYVQRELRIVLDYADYKPEGTLYIIPVRLEDCVPPRRLRAWHYADFFPKEGRERAFQRLLVSLKRRADSLGLKYETPMLSKVDTSYESANRENSKYYDGRLEIDAVRHHILINGLRVKVTPLEFRLLVYLERNAGKVLTYEQILENVWGKEYRGSIDFVHVYISYLRSKIEENPKEPRYIRSVHGVGYIFERQDLAAKP